MLDAAAAKKVENIVDVAAAKKVEIIVHAFRGSLFILLMMMRALLADDVHVFINFSIPRTFFLASCTTVGLTIFHIYILVLVSVLVLVPVLLLSEEELLCLFAAGALFMSAAALCSSASP